MTEALCGRLARIHDLRVISRTSVMRFQGHEALRARDCQNASVWMPLSKGRSYDRAAGFGCTPS